MCLNRTSEWKVMTIWISRELPLFNFVRLDILCAWIGPPSEKLWPFDFLESFRCSIFSISICEALELDIWVKSYDQLNFSRASVVQFGASRYMLRLNRSSVWKVMTIWISRELPLFYFERCDLWCAWIGHPSEKLSPFEFLETFRCLIWSDPIYYWPELDIWVKSYGHLDLPCVSMFNFEHLDLLCAWIGHLSEKLGPYELAESFVVRFRASRYSIGLNRTSESKVMAV